MHLECRGSRRQEKNPEEAEECRVRNANLGDPGERGAVQVQQQGAENPVIPVAGSEGKRQEAGKERGEQSTQRQEAGGKRVVSERRGRTARRGGRRSLPRWCSEPIP